MASSSEQDSFRFNREVDDSSTQERRLRMPPWMAPRRMRRDYAVYRRRIQTNGNVSFPKEMMKAWGVRPGSHLQWVDLGGFAVVLTDDHELGEALQVVLTEHLAKADEERQAAERRRFAQRSETAAGERPDHEDDSGV